jgi:hypothetical protein
MFGMRMELPVLPGEGSRRSFPIFCHAFGVATALYNKTF